MSDSPNADYLSRDAVLDILRAELAYSLRLIPRLEWAVQVAQAKLAKHQAELALAMLRHDD